MSVLWAVPVVAAAVATGLVVVRARALEDASVAVVHEVGRLAELPTRLVAVGAALQETSARAAAFRLRHPLAPIERPRGAAPGPPRHGGDAETGGPP